MELNKLIDYYFEKAENPKLHKSKMLNTDTYRALQELVMYKNSLILACDLMLGAYVFGNDKDSIFEKILEENGIVSGEIYAMYLVNHYDEINGNMEAQKDG